MKVNVKAIYDRAGSEWLERKSVEETKIWVPLLRVMGGRAVVSPKLRYAIRETRKALENGDYHLACSISSAKSFVCSNYAKGGRDPENAFREDAKANEKLFGVSVYVILDQVTSDIAFALREMPAGLTELSASGVRERPIRAEEHPVVARMKFEHDEIYRKYEERKRREEAEEKAKATQVAAP